MRLLLPVLLLAQSGCASVAFGPCGKSTVDDIACAAFHDDKGKLYELGRRYELGEGVPIDLKRARGLYRAAAASTPETIYVYSPGINGAAGRVIPVNTGRGGPGLDVATIALARIEAAISTSRKRGEH